MISDYSTRYSTVTAGQRLHPRKTPSSHQSVTADNRLVLKAVGAMVAFTLIAGLTSTFWYGWQIRVALDEIGKNNNIQQTLLIQRQSLTSERNQLLERKNIELAAAKLGLFPPSKKQLRNP